MLLNIHAYVFECLCYVLYMFMYANMLDLRMLLILMQEWLDSFGGQRRKLIILY